MSRRSFIKTVGTGLGVVGTSTSVTARTTTATLRPGTSQETPIHRNDSGEPGPTALLIGGVHGNERAGYLAAERLADWTPERGTTIVVPRTNAVAVENGTREANGDLNRQFPIEKRPTTPLAQSLLELVEQSQPDVIVDLHESTGRYIDGWLGQSVAHPRFDSMQPGLRRVLGRLNRSVQGIENQFHTRPLPGPDEQPSGVFVQWAAFERNIPAFLVETYDELPLKDRLQYHETIARGLVRSANSHRRPPLRTRQKPDSTTNTQNDSTWLERLINQLS